MAMVVKHTDNILKAFATSAALVGVALVSAVYFSFPIRPLFVAGAILVVKPSHQPTLSQRGGGFRDVAILFSCPKPS